MISFLWASWAAYGSDSRPPAPNSGSLGAFETACDGRAVTNLHQPIKLAFSDVNGFWSAGAVRSAQRVAQSAARAE